MIALVRIALRRPYTFVVLALVILIVGPLAALRTPVDIFPDIRIPVVAIVWQYTGLPPADMAGRITTQSERALTTTVNDIEHIEATSYNGLGIIKVYFQPGADIRTRQRADHGDLADATQANAAGRDAAADPQLQRVDRSDHPARALRLRPVRADARRSRPQYRSHPSRYCSRGRNSPALRRQAARRFRSTSIPARCKRAVCRARMSPMRWPHRT